MTAYRASQQYKIPKQTLSDKLRGRTNIKAQLGRPTALTNNEEEEIVETCIFFADWGFGLKMSEVVKLVSEYCSLKRKNPFIHGVPTAKWCRNFLRRHPQITRRKPQQLQMVRARASHRESVQNFFDHILLPILNEHHLLDKPSQIYNADESFLALSGGSCMILARKGTKAPQRVIGGSGRENITIHTCFSASGQYVPPYVVYKGKRLMLQHTQGGPVGTRYSVSPAGWMTQKTFIDWFKSLFLPSLPAERPILLILDGHDSHVTYELRCLAAANDVHLIRFPPHTTHFLQPLDVGFFKPFKASWNRAVVDYTRRELKAVTKATFPAILSKAWNESIKKEYAVSGFKRTGIYPFNPTAIPNSTYTAGEIFHIQSQVDNQEDQFCQNGEENRNNDNAGNDDNACNDDNAGNDDNIDDNNGNGDENCNHDHNSTNGINNEEFWDDFDNSFSDDNYDFDSSQMHIPSVIEALADDIAEDVHRVVNPDEHAPVPELLTNGVRSETVCTTMNAMPENGTSTPIDNHAPHHERDAEVSTTEGELATPVTNSCTCTSQKEPESLNHFAISS